MSVREWRCKTVPPAAFHRVGGNSMEGVKDVQGGAVRSSAPGLHGGRDEHAGGCPSVRSAPGYGAQDAGLFNAARATGGRLLPEGPSWSPTPASSARSLRATSAFPGSSGTPPSASSSGCATSTGLRASTPSSRTTSGSAAAGPRRCSCRCPMPRAMLRATSERPG